MKFYEPKTGEMVPIWVSQREQTYKVTLNNKMMYPREAELYAKAAGLVRKRPKIVEPK